MTDNEKKVFDFIYSNEGKTVGALISKETSFMDVAEAAQSLIRDGKITPYLSGYKVVTTKATPRNNQYEGEYKMKWPIYRVGARDHETYKSKGILC